MGKVTRKSRWSGRTPWSNSPKVPQAKPTPATRSGARSPLPGTAFRRTAAPPRSEQPDAFFVQRRTTRPELGTNEAPLQPALLPVEDGAERRARVCRTAVVDDQHVARAHRHRGAGPLGGDEEFVQGFPAEIGRAHV